MTQYMLLETVTQDKLCEQAWRKLKGRLKLLGELRDLHVQRIFVEERMTSFPELGLVRAFLEQRQYPAHQKINQESRQAKHPKTGEVQSGNLPTPSDCVSG